MFDGFRRDDLNVGDAVIHYRTGGQGPALLLLHGFPQSHVHWHALAPLLAEDFTVVAPDLRGYGDSTGPGASPGHHAYSKRMMAADMVRLMEHLGHTRFDLAGHDRGGRVAYRLTLDHPERVRRLVSLDTAPTIDVWDAMDMVAAVDAFHWSFLAQPHPLPEKLIGSEPVLFLNHLIGRWKGPNSLLNPDALAEYERHIVRSSVITAMCEDYRAGATVDLEHDRQDRRAGKRISCPMLVLRGKQYQTEPLLPIWQRWAEDTREIAFQCGHFLAEEDPYGCAKAIRAFLA